MLKFNTSPRLHRGEVQAMVTVPEATKKIVERSRYLSEALSKGIINNSSLARYIKPEIEEMLVKKVSMSSVIMALNRMETNLPSTPYKTIFRNPPEIVARANLALITSEKPIPSLIDSAYYATISKNRTVILAPKRSPNIKNSKTYYPVSSISITLPEEAQNTPGIYYFLIKSLAWERINILSTFSSSREYAIVVENRDAQRTLGILKSVFEEIN